MKNGGAVGAVAWHHVIELSRVFKVYAITRDIPDDRPANVVPLRVTPLSWNGLRRFCHVPNELSFLWAVRRRLSRLCRQQRVMAVWCHSHSQIALVGAPLRKTFGFRLVMTTHGDIFDRPPGTYDPVLTWFYRRVTRPAYRLADRVVVLSPYMADWAARGGAAPNAVTLIPNGIDPAEIGLMGDEPPPSESPAGPFELLYVGRLAIEKGVDVLLDAVRLLESRAIDLNLRIVGQGPEMSRLQAQAARLDRPDRVIFLGPVPRRFLGALYRSADLVCIPSRSEPLPTVALEAMIAGRPMLGARTGGIPFLVEDGLSGWLVPPCDPEAMAKTMERLIYAPEALAKAGLAAQHRAKHEFAWRRIGRVLTDVILGLVADHRDLHGDETS